MEDLRLQIQTINRGAFVIIFTLFFLSRQFQHTKKGSDRCQTSPTHCWFNCLLDLKWPLDWLFVHNLSDCLNLVVVTSRNDGENYKSETCSCEFCFPAVFGKVFGFWVRLVPFCYIKRGGWVQVWSFFQCNLWISLAVIKWIKEKVASSLRLGLGSV